MALSDTQRKNLTVALIALLSAVAGIYAESSGFLGDVAKFILSLLK